MKDYARNNFRQKSRDIANNDKDKTSSKIKPKRKRLVIYIFCLIVIILILWVLVPSSSEKNIVNPPSEQQNFTQTDLKNQSNNTLETPEVFQTVSPSITTSTDVKTSDELTPNSEVQTPQLTNEDMNTSANAVVASSNSTKTAEATDNQQPKFTFYKNLSSQTVQSDATANKAKKYIYTYMLQVGSYKNLKAVNAIRARLILIGLKPQVSKHGSWYRIDIGPVYSKRDGDILRHKLEAAKISGSMLRQISKKEAPVEAIVTTTTISS